MLVRNNFYKAFLITAIAGLLLLPLPLNNLWWREVFNSSHTFLFIFISFLFYKRLKIHFSFSKNIYVYVYVFLLGMLLGVLIEIIQSQVHREASFHDVYRDYLGIMSGICMLAALDLKKKLCNQLLPAVFLLISASFLLLSMAPLAKLSLHYIERNNDFPVIVNFGAPWMSTFVRLDNVVITQAENITQKKPDDFYVVRFIDGKYPGISVIETKPDWTHYSRLRMNILSQYEYIVYLVLRIHDRFHNNEYADRYNKKIAVVPGLNTIDIAFDEIKQGPANRQLDLTRVAGLILFATKLEEPVQLEIGDIYLE